MRFKYYIRGFGLGILLTTIVLMVSYNIHGSMSDEQVKEAALKLGMIDPNETQTESNGTIKQEQEKVNSQATENVSTEPQSQDIQEPEDTQKPEDTQQTEADTQAPADTQQEELVLITIENGDTCADLAQMLFDAKLIDNIDDFKAYMREYDYDNKLHTGIYRIAHGATYDDIAKVLILEEDLVSP